MEENKPLEVSMEQAQAADALDQSTVEQVHNPTEFEQKMVDEEKARLNAFMDNEEQLSLMTIKLLTPRFRSAVDKLGSRAVKRVLKSIVEYPLHDYTHKDEDEVAAFRLGNVLTDAKLVLMMHTYNENKDTIIDQALKEAAAKAEFEFGNKAEQTMNEQQTEQGTNNG